MARVRHDDLTAHDGLAVALRWLRHRRRLTQPALREAVTAAGGSISLIYIQQLEAGRKRPSPRMLDLLLAALGSDRDELRTVLADTTDAPTPARDRGWRPSRRDPLASPAGAAWSDEVLVTHAMAPAPEPPLAELARLAEDLDPESLDDLLRTARRLAGRPRGDTEDDPPE